MKINAAMIDYIILGSCCLGPGNHHGCWRDPQIESEARLAELRRIEIVWHYDESNRTSKNLEVANALDVWIVPIEEWRSECYAAQPATEPGFIYPTYMSTIKSSEVFLTATPEMKSCRIIIIRGAGVGVNPVQAVVEIRRSTNEILCYLSISL